MFLKKFRVMASFPPIVRRSRWLKLVCRQEGSCEFGWDGPDGRELDIQACIFKLKDSAAILTFFVDFDNYHNL
jgi:hypothetical protein